MSYDQVRRSLEQAGASLRCNTVVQQLKSLGFKVDGKTGHKKFKHPSLPQFHGGSFNCGHGKNSEVKRVYIRRIIQILDDYEDEIKESLNK